MRKRKNFVDILYYYETEAFQLHTMQVTLIIIQTIYKDHPSDCQSINQLVSLYSRIIQIALSECSVYSSL